MQIDEQGMPPELAAAFEAVYQALGEGPAEFGTAGKLVELLSQLPPRTPIQIADHAQTDPDLDEGVTESRKAYAATISAALDPQTRAAVDGFLTYRQVLPAVRLGAYIVAEEGRVPAHTVAYPAYEQAAEGLRTGDLDLLLTGCHRLVKDVADILAEELDAALLERLTDDAGARIRLEGGRLTQAALRLGALRTPVGVEPDAT